MTDKEGSAGCWDAIWDDATPTPDTRAALVERLLDVVKRIRQWDHLDTAGDGPYWKRELDAVLALSLPPTQVGSMPEPQPSEEAVEAATRQAAGAGVRAMLEAAYAVDNQRIKRWVAEQVATVAAPKQESEK